MPGDLFFVGWAECITWWKCALRRRRNDRQPADGRLLKMHLCSLHDFGWRRHIPCPGKTLRWDKRRCWVRQSLKASLSLCFCS